MYPSPHPAGPEYTPDPSPSMPVPALAPQAFRADTPISARGPAAAAAVLGTLLAIVGYVGDHAHPRSAVSRWRAVVSRGDLGTLLRDERLGGRRWIRALIQEQGTADYNRVLGIYDRAAELGQAEYRRLHETVIRQGEQAFAALPDPEQRAVSSRSHDEWVCANGVARVPEAGALGGCATLRAAPSPQLLQRLGTPELDADEQALLANRATNDPAVLADVTLAELANRRDALGQRVLERLRERVEREGDRAFRRLDWSERDAVDRQSRERFVRDRGFASLPPSDRARVGQVDGLFDESSQLPTALGMQQLPEAERREVQGRSREDFVARRARYIEDAGSRLAQQLLISSFGSAQVRVEKLYVHGSGGRDLLRRNAARAELSWSSLGSGVMTPSSIALHWSSEHVDWRIDEVTWSPRTTEGGDE